MKLRKIQPPLRHPFQWARWTFLGELPADKLPSRPTSLKGAPRSLFLRHLDCGSCNGCELALHALNTPYYDLPGHGIHFVASPRHADLLVMTGPVTINMVDAALTTLRQLSRPKILAIGDCAIDGGIFRDAYGVLPIDERPEELSTTQKIAGCPPDPDVIMNAILKVQI